MNDERLLNCEFCGCKFFDIPDMALFGWDDDRPMYACQSCDAAQHRVQPTGGTGAQDDDALDKSNVGTTASG